MYALKASTRACGVARAGRSAARVPVVQRPAGLRRVAVRAATEEKNAADDFSQQATEAVNKAVDYLKDVWEKTADAEKPAAIAIILASIVAQIAIGATMDAVDRLPFVSDLFELIGVAVVATFTYKYVTDPSERAATKSTVDGMISKVTGK